MTREQYEHYLASRQSEFESAMRDSGRRALLWTVATGGVEVVDSAGWCAQTGLAFIPAAAPVTFALDTARGAAEGLGRGLAEGGPASASVQGAVRGAAAAGATMAMGPLSRLAGGISSRGVRFVGQRLNRVRGGIHLAVGATLTGVAELGEEVLTTVGDTAINNAMRPAPRAPDSGVNVANGPDIPVLQRPTRADARPQRDVPVLQRPTGADGPPVLQRAR